jgi:flavin reductase (DIM6/NTAB) family NADH-FMN oxidoreductase RutF
MKYMYKYRSIVPLENNWQTGLHDMLQCEAKCLPSWAILPHRHSIKCCLSDIFSTANATIGYNLILLKTHQSKTFLNANNDGDLLNHRPQMNSSSSSARTREFDSIHFRRVLSQFATGVTVITTRQTDGSFLGLTANSFNSLSLDPPLVLWSLSTKASSMPVFTSNSHYVINVLSANQASLAERFSKRIENRFEGVDFSLSRTGQPILSGVTAWFECHNRSRYPEGDHVIFVGEVERCEAQPQAALVYHDGQFGGTPT